jgi:hypothetical protein
MHQATVRPVQRPGDKTYPDRARSTRVVPHRAGRLPPATHSEEPTTSSQAQADHGIEKSEDRMHDVSGVVGVSQREVDTASDQDRASEKQNGAERSRKQTPRAHYFIVAGRRASARHQMAIM